MDGVGTVFVAGIYELSAFLATLQSISLDALIELYHIEPVGLQLPGSELVNGFDLDKPTTQAWLKASDARSSIQAS